ncbi:hypothetical protein D9M70_509420 [compost metagenome]
MPGVARRRHHLQPQAQLARVAVAQHRGAAGVGRQVAADGAAALGRQAQREQPAVLACHVLQVLQHHAGFDGNGVVERIDLADAVEPLQRQHHRIAPGRRRGAAAQAGIAALRHHRHLVRMAGMDRGRDFLGGAGTQHGQRLAAVALAPVGQVGGLVGGPGQHVLRAQRGAAQGEEGVLGRGHGRGIDSWGAPAQRFCGAALAAARARRLYGRRYRMVLVKNTSVSATSTQASVAEKPRSLVARTMPSVKNSRISIDDHCMV